MRPLPRRRLLKGSALAATGAVLAPLAACTGGGDAGDGPASTSGASSPATSSPGTSPGTTAPAVGEDPASWRDQFALTRDVAHFAAFTLAAHPRPVADAIARHRAGLDEDTARYLAENEQNNDEAVRAAAAEYLDAHPDEIALTDSTTMGLGVVYGGLRLRESDEVVTTNHDFYSTYESLRLRARQTGATIRTVDLYDDPATVSQDELVGRLVDAVGPKTRALAVTWVHSGTGVKLPIGDLGRRLADLNDGRDERDRVLLIVDAVHALGVELDTPEKLGCDVLVAGTHKWLWGPRGTGIVWLHRRAWPAIEPVIAPFAAENFIGWLNSTPPERGPGGPALSPGGYHTFEHRWALAEAFRFHLDIGKANVERITHGQASQLKGLLAGADGIRVVTPEAAELSAGIVCVEFETADPLSVLGQLLERGYVTGMTPYRNRYLRMGPSIVTTAEETEGLAGALADVA